MISTSNSVTKRIAALFKLFNGVVASNYNFFTIEKLLAPKLQVQLSAKEGYGFNTTTNETVVATVVINSFKYNNKTIGKFYNLNNINNKKNIIN
ncbi:MAG: hypothetical protein ACRDBR_02495 [Metamycoplasmataceae bacterium]